MFRRSVLIAAFVFCLPVLWSALVDQTMTWESVGIRFLIALPLASVLLALVRLAAREPAPAASDEPREDAAAPY